MSKLHELIGTMPEQLTAELEKWIYEALDAGRMRDAERLLLRLCDYRAVVNTLASRGEQFSRQGDFAEACRYFKLALAACDQIWTQEQHTAALFAARRLLEITAEMDSDGALPILNSAYRVIWRLKKRVHK